MIQLDGRYGEGGGALVRTALALSTLTGKSFEVKDIRAGRPNPGLKAQHLTAINALKEITGAETNKIFLGSTGLSFIPGRVKRGIYNIDIGTAGSITLLLQALILPCLFAPGKVILNVKGGTCGKWQASVDYLRQALLPQLQRFVAKIELKILRRGYYPKGNGAISLEIVPKIRLSDFPDFNEGYEKINLTVPKIKLIEQGRLERMEGIVNISKPLEDKKVGERIKKTAELKLKHYQVPIEIRIDHAESLSIGGEALLWAVFSRNGKEELINPIILASDVLVEPGKSSEQIGIELAEKLGREIDSGAAVDVHLADQLILFMAMLPGSEIKTSEVSKHAQTNCYVSELFLPVKFECGEKVIRMKKK